MGDLVECHSEHEYPERPVALTWQGRRLQIVEILNSWRAPQGRVFRVLAEDEGEFELSYDIAEDTWQIRQL